MRTRSDGLPAPAHSITSSVGAENIPPEVRSLHALERVDYADMCSIDVSGAELVPAEDWARAALEADPLGTGARRVFRTLGLRLAPRGAAGHVQGWRIAGRGDHWLRLEASSWFMTAHAVLRADEGRVSIALFIQYDNPVARVVWIPASFGHRRGVPALLREAIRRLGPA